MGAHNSSSSESSGVINFLPSDKTNFGTDQSTEKDIKGNLSEDKKHTKLSKSDFLKKLSGDKYQMYKISNGGLVERPIGQPRSVSLKDYNNRTNSITIPMTYTPDTANMKSQRTAQSLTSRYDQPVHMSSTDGKHACSNGATMTIRSRSASPGRCRCCFGAKQNMANFKKHLEPSEKLRSHSTSRTPNTSRDMTSFVIGRPANFSSGAYGDLGVFRSISNVNDHLYICGVMALTEEKVKALKIDCVINATLDWPHMKIPGLETIRVQVDDLPLAPISQYFDRVADKIKEVASRGGRVLVHCMAGVSRSSSLCIAYLMKYKGLTLTQALSFMKSRRSIIRPNDGFYRQLVQYEKHLKRSKVNSSSASGKAEKSSETVRNNSSNHHGYSQQMPIISPTKDRPAEQSLFLKGVSSIVSKPSENLASSAGTSSARPPANHTISNGSYGISSLSQREIALGARSVGNWSTTYKNDFTARAASKR